MCLHLPPKPAGHRQQTSTAFLSVALPYCYKVNVELSYKMCFYFLLAAKRITPIGTLIDIK